MNGPLTALTGYSVPIMDTLRLPHTLAMVRHLENLWNHFENQCVVSDPREYSISTKDFVVDEEGKLKGLNTGTLYRSIPVHGKKRLTEIVQSVSSGPKTVVDAGRWRKCPGPRSSSLRS